MPRWNLKSIFGGVAGAAVMAATYHLGLSNIDLRAENKYLRRELEARSVYFSVDSRGELLVPFYPNSIEKAIAARSEMDESSWCFVYDFEQRGLVYDEGLSMQYEGLFIHYVRSLDESNKSAFLARHLNLERSAPTTSP